MKYSISGISIKSLIEKHKDEKIILNPPYQRNPIWSRNAQKALISTRDILAVGLVGTCL